MNTTLESLGNGVPMVAIPITNVQPGVAARMLTEDSYKKNVLRLQEAIHRAGRVSRAADIIEQAISTGKPVLSQAK